MHALKMDLRVDISSTALSSARKYARQKHHDALAVSRDLLPLNRAVRQVWQANATFKTLYKQRVK